MLGKKNPVMITSDTKPSKTTVTSNTMFKPKVNVIPRANTTLTTPTPTIPPGNCFVFL